MRVLIAVLLATAPAVAEEKPDDLVDVATVIPDAVIDMRYAGKDNFVGEVMYPKAVCKLRRAVAARLAKAAAVLRQQDRRLVLWDCYRPSSIQKLFWEKLPDPRYVADPKRGSRHSRGAAVDIALADKDGNLGVLPTKHDEFSQAAHRANALAGRRGVEARRLSRAMVGAGFQVMATEWWHFDAPEGASYALSDEPL